MTLERTEKIRCNSEQEAKETIELFRKDAADHSNRVKKASYEYKAKKAKGEVVAEAWIVTVTTTISELWEDME